LLVPSAIAVTAALLFLRLYFQPPTVPRYALEIAGADGDEVDLGRDARFAMELHPVEPVIGAIAARGFLLRGNDVRPWNAPFEVERDGSVRLTGPVDALFAQVPSGVWEVAIAVGRPETLPTAPRDILRARDAPDDTGTAAWRLLRKRIKLRPST
jgi:hypothetical protein